MIMITTTTTGISNIDADHDDDDDDLRGNTLNLIQCKINNNKVDIDAFHFSIEFIHA